MRYLEEFNVYRLFEICKPSLDEIEFENSPFRKHLICIQSIINSQRLIGKEPQKVEIDKGEEKEQEVIIVHKDPVVQRDAWMQATDGERYEIGFDNLHVDRGEAQGESLKKPVDDDAPVSPSKYTFKDVADEIHGKVTGNDGWRERFITKVKFIQFWWKEIIRIRAKRGMAYDSHAKLLYTVDKIEKVQGADKKYRIELWAKYETERIIRVNHTHSYVLRVYDETCFDKFKQLDYDVTDNMEKALSDDHKASIRLLADDLATAREKKHLKDKPYSLIRLPKANESEDEVIIRNKIQMYIHDATYIGLEEDGKIKQVKLIRMKFNIEKLDIIRKRKWDIPGMNLVLEFELVHYPGHWCRVYKRYRRDLEIPKLIVKDWVIFVY